MSFRAKFYDWLRRRTSPKARRWFKQQKWFMPLTNAFFSTDVYSASYFEDIERLEKDSVDVIAKWVSENLQPKTIIDVGCGPGHMMEAFHNRKIDVFGVDISKHALNKVREKNLKAKKVDLTKPNITLPGVPYDLAISCEVAEHLHEKYANTFVKRMCEASNTIYITAAEPDKNMGPGMMHFNEQPNEYWIKLFEEEGYDLDRTLTDDARNLFGSSDVISYLAKPMIFRRSGNQI